MDAATLMHDAAQRAVAENSLFQFMLEYLARISERYNSDLALILLAVEPTPGQEADQWEKAMPELAEWLVAEISTNVRLSDLVCYVGDGLCAVLMPNTPARRAMLAAIRLIEGPIAPSRRPLHLPPYRIYAAVGDFRQAKSVERLVCSTLTALSQAAASDSGTVWLALPDETLQPIPLWLQQRWPKMARLGQPQGQASEPSRARAMS